MYRLFSIFLTLIILSNCHAMRTPLNHLPENLRSLRSKSDKVKQERAEHKYRKRIQSFERNRIFYHIPNLVKFRLSMG